MWGDDEMNTVGERIRFRRELLGMSQTKLADSVGVSKQTIYKYENNLISNIPSDKLEQIATCLETTPAWLIGWSETDSTADNIPRIEERKEGIWLSLSYLKAVKGFSRNQLGWLLDSLVDYAQNGTDPDFSCFENTSELKEMKLAWRFAMSIYEKEGS